MDRANHHIIGQHSSFRQPPRVHQISRRRKRRGPFQANHFQQKHSSYTRVWSIDGTLWTPAGARFSFGNLHVVIARARIHGSREHGAAECNERECHYQAHSGTSFSQKYWTTQRNARGRIDCLMVQLWIHPLDAILRHGHLSTRFRRALLCLEESRGPIPFKEHLYRLPCSGAHFHALQRDDHRCYLRTLNHRYTNAILAYRLQQRGYIRNCLFHGVRH